MKRRVLSSIIALALCLNLFPVGAFAADTGTDDGLCPHHPAHTDACGYVAGEPGAPCLFACAICPIENLIGRLPSRLSAGNAEQVQAQIEEIYTLYDALTGEEQRQVDLSPCAALLNQMDGMGSAVLADGSGSGIEEYVLPGDTEKDEPYVVNYPIIITTKGYTLTGLQSSAIQVTGTGELRLRGGGAIISKSGAGVEVQSGGKLYLEDPIRIEGTTYALDIAAEATVQLAPGTYSGGIAAINVADGNYAALLGEGCAFFEGGSAISPENLANAKTLTVGQCTNHSSKTYAHNSGETTHTWTCDYCGTSGTDPEQCTFSFDQNGSGTCGFCDSEITVVVDRESLKELAYDDTVQPANGTVTVKVTDAASPLTAGTDYTVSYSTRAEVGSTDITVTVTVTGNAYKGTFTQDYTFTKEELEIPVLQWASDNVSVPYTGSPVAKGQLPGVTINNPHRIRRGSERPAPVFLPGAGEQCLHRRSAHQRRHL